MLGGSTEFLADQHLRERGLDPVEHAEEYEAAWPGELEKVKEQVAKEHDEVRELGGLYVVGTERHESRRIDNQLRGRAGRQGDPGKSRFYISLEDDLMRLFGGERLQGLMDKLKIDDDTPIEIGKLRMWSEPDKKHPQFKKVSHQEEARSLTPGLTGLSNFSRK